jgi:RNA polymerase sigma factor (TIGR02999 family)
MLRSWREGDLKSREQLIAHVYARVRAMAARRLQADRAARTLDPTELAHEVFAELLGAEIDWKDRVHFFRTVAMALRRQLVDLARERMSAKRGADAEPLTLSALDARDEDADGPLSDLSELDQALDALKQLDSRKADIVELNYFGGLTREEIARVHAISVPTVDRELRFARAWLRERLGHG